MVEQQILFAAKLNCMCQLYGPKSAYQGRGFWTTGISSGPLNYKTLNYFEGWWLGWGTDY